jgi:hypothetical protein
VNSLMKQDQARRHETVAKWLRTTIGALEREMPHSAVEASVPLHSEGGDV